MVYLRVFSNGRYLQIPLDIFVRPEDFDKQKNLVIAGAKKTTYNNLIKKAIGDASDIILRYQVNKKTLTKDLFIKEFRNNASLTNFYAFMEEQIKLRSGEITKSSAKQHMTCLSKMREFKKSLMMAELDESFIRDFENYLRNKVKNNQNTIYNNLKVLRTYVNRAIKQELMSVSPFRYFKPKKVESYPVFLTEEERTILENLYNENSLNPKHQKVLRWFLFSCYTGLRISDLRRVKYENIENGVLSFKPLKTENINGKRVEVPLIDKDKKLMTDEFPHRLKGLIFECYVDQVMNRYIKEVLEVAKIEKAVSFHTARHTFATLFLKKCRQANGLLILKKLLGHSNIETTMVYTHILNEDVREAMQNF